MSDVAFMRLCLQLAARADGQTHPNPMVGAVVVRNGARVGQGFHRRAGQKHAEVLALRQADKRARGATLYVSLEPCAHSGRTPPCTQAIVKSGVRRVVAAMVDPNPKNRGRGLRFLKARGIQTRVGVLEKEARALNRVFVTWMTLKRPFVTVKVAQSMDGKIATWTGQSRWISGPEARRWVHRLRSQVDAVLVGVETVLKDDPLLTVRSPFTLRLSKGEFGSLKQPLRVILDTHLRTPPTARLFRACSKTSSSRKRGSVCSFSDSRFRGNDKGDASVLIAASRGASKERERRLRRAGAEILRLPSLNGRVDLRVLLKQLAQREISHLLIEGGGEVIASAFAAGVVDRMACVIAPKVIGGRGAPTSVEGKGVTSPAGAISLKNLSATPLGMDLLVMADVQS